MARLFAAFLVSVVLFGWTPNALAEPRIATLVGNSNYPAGMALPNPVSDVRLLEKRLKALGFDVRVYTDVDSRTLSGLISEHASRLTTAGASAVGFFLYSGHATQVDGQNFLFGVDLSEGLSGPGAWKLSASVAADLISQRIGAAGNRVNFIILDACRTDPTGRNGAGLAIMTAPKGALLAYSTGPGQKASDGRGANSPYAQALDAALGEPGLTAEQVFRRTRERVGALTAGEQVPYENSALVGDDFYFNGGKTDPAEAARRRAEDEKVMWASVSESNDVTMLQTYLASYPSGNFSAMARRKIAEISAAEDKARELRLRGVQPRAGVSVAGQGVAAGPSGDSLIALDGRRLVTVGRDLGVNLGVILEGTHEGALLKVRVHEVSEASPFFGKLTAGDEIVRINHEPVAEANLASALEDAFNLQRRVDLTVKRGAVPYSFSYVEPKRMGN